MVIIWLMMVNNNLVCGFNQPLWKMMVFVSWEYDIANWMESHNPVMFQTTNQDVVLIRPLGIYSNSGLSMWNLSWRTPSIFEPATFDWRVLKGISIQQ